MKDIRDTWYFVQVAHAGTFSAAAERLSLSTATLSKSVARLERRMGVRLFARTSRRVSLTSEGRHLLNSAERALRTITDGIEQVRGRASEPTGVVRLSTVTSYGKHCVLPLLPEFFARYPGITLIISFHDGGRDLSRQSFDVRINWGDEQEPGKISHKLCEMALIVVASPAYVTRNGVPRVPKDLERHDCINVIFSRSERPQWTFTREGDSSRNRVHVRPKGHVLVMDELEAVVDAAVAGLGVTVTSVDNVLPQLRDGRLVQLL